MPEFKIKQFLYTIKSIRTVWKSAPKLTLLNFFITLLQSAFSLLSIYMMKLIIDEITSAADATDKSTALIWVMVYLGLTALVLLLAAACSSIIYLVKEHLSQYVKDNIIRSIHTKAGKLDLAYYENSSYHDLFYRTISEAPSRPTSIVNSLVQLSQSLFSFVFMAGILFYCHWLIGLVLIVATIPGFIVRMRYSKLMYKWQNENTSKEREQNYFSGILTSSSFAKEIRLFGLTELFQNKYNTIRNELRKGFLFLIRKGSYLDFVSQVLGILSLFFALAFVALQAIQGEITIGSLVMYFLAFQRSIGFLKDMLGNLSIIYEDNLYFAKYFEFLKLKNKIVEHQAITTITKPLQKGIVFDKVSFSYPNSNRTVFKELSLTIPDGKTIALVGCNGAGKTTLIKLLCKLYLPDSGSIIIEGVNIIKYSSTDLRKNISVVFQDFVLYNQPAKDNIWYGDINKNIDMYDIRKAAEKAGFDDFLINLPKGYDTMLGNLFSDSEELSLGEWQKLALARAFYRDSEIVILDEPTSSMDANAEFELFERFKKIIKGKTSIIVSHRFSTVKMADYIFVLDKGSVAEQGTHEELLSKNGLYATMYHLQAQKYKD